MIEVIMALTIVALMAVFTVSVGRRWQQRRLEANFFERVRTEWQYDLTAAEANNSPVRVSWQQSDHMVTFRGGAWGGNESTPVVAIPIPRTLFFGGGTMEWKITNKGMVTAPHRAMFQSTAGSNWQVAIEIEWGQLEVHTDDN
nr:hypothetical protein [Lacticaseibacillus thailandensis]